MESLKYKLDEFILIFLYFLNTNFRNCLTNAYINQEFNLIEILKVNLLVDNNIFVTKGVIIHLAIKIAKISSYQAIISVITRPKGY